MNAKKNDGLDFNWLRTSIASDEGKECKDLRLCAADVFESVCYSNDTKETKIQNINWLNELYLADKGNYDEETAKDMEQLMSLLAELLETEFLEEAEKEGK